MLINNLQQLFSDPLLNWFDSQGRKDLPWQHLKTPYPIWIAEMMLQQTQVQTVIPFFKRFISRFPTISQLSLATEDEVLAHWSGLGYYSRARHIHKTAKIICEKYNGEIPSTLDELIRLPGIGPSTAAAIASQAFNQPTAILDGNVKRVLSRYFMIAGSPEQAATRKKLWEAAKLCMPKTRCADYTQAIMDLGALCCTKRHPNCLQCPLHTTCQAKQYNKVMDFPFKKIKKSLPIKHEQFIILFTKEKAIYLEKKPPVGLWGGLWCLPSIDLEANIHEFIKKKYEAIGLKPTKLPPFKHTFSHFHLYIYPIALQVEERTSCIAENPHGWFTEAQLATLGLPKPISKIILNLNSYLNAGSEQK